MPLIHVFSIRSLSPSGWHVSVDVTMPDPPIYAKVFEEDTVRLLRAPLTALGVVSRTWHDLEDEETGDLLLPRGHVAVNWLGIGPAWHHQDELEVVDRSLNVGDVCKRRYADAQSGTVVKVESSLELEHAFLDEKLSSVPTTQVVNGLEFLDGKPVAFENWLGLIEEYIPSITVQLANDSIVTVADSFDLRLYNTDEDDPDMEPLYIGHKVSTVKGNLRRGKWKRGRYDAAVPPVGTIVEVEALAVLVRWVTFNPADKFAGEVHEPPSHFHKDQFHRLHLVTEVDEISSYQVGDRVQLVAEAARRLIPGRVELHPRRRCDVNVYIVTSTSTRVSIQWQDTSISHHDAKDLLPYLNVDERDIWPGEFAWSAKVAKELTGPASLSYGIVRSVDAAARVCDVVWHADWDAKLPKHIAEQQHSLYEIETHESFAFRRGDLCYIGYDLRDMWRKAGSPNLSLDMIDAFAKLQGMTASQDEVNNLRHAMRVNGSPKMLRFLQLLNDAITKPTDPDAWFGQILDFDAEGNALVLVGYAIDMPPVNVSIERLRMLRLDSFEDEDSTFDWAQESTDYSEWTDADDDEELEDIDPVTDDAWSTESDASDPVSPVLPVAKEETDGGTEWPVRFSNLDDPPPGHHFIHLQSNNANMARIHREHRIIQTSLPENIFVTTYASRLDLMRVLVIGNSNTPYAYAPFLFDIHFPSNFPHEPPLAFFYSWTQGMGRLNPNLYENGRICLSLLGTWHSRDESEGWTKNSTILQILISLQSLVLVREPYFNEAGFDVYINTAEAEHNSQIFSERAYMLSQIAIAHLLESRPMDPEAKINHLYIDPNGPGLLGKAIENLRLAIAGHALPLLGVGKLSEGALSVLRRTLESLQPWEPRR